AWELSDKRIFEVYTQRARLHELQGNKEAAAVDLENFLKVQPNAPNAAAIRQAIETLRKKSNKLSLVESYSQQGELSQNICLFFERVHSEKEKYFSPNYSTLIESLLNQGSLV